MKIWRVTDIREERQKDILRGYLSPAILCAMNRQFYSINMASPKEKNRYLSCPAAS